MASQRRVKKVGRVSVVELPKMVPFSAIVVDEDTSRAEPAPKNMDIGEYGCSGHCTVASQCLEKALQSPGRNPFFPEFQAQFSQDFSCKYRKGAKFVLEEAHGDIIPAEKDRTENHAAPRQSSGKDGAASAAPTGFSWQRASKAPARRAARKYRER